MTSYNAINGTPAVADTYTVNQLAQRTYGFDGYITSDCGAIGTTYQNPPGGHDWAPPGWTTDNQGSNSTWTNTATGAKVSGVAGGQAYALRAGTALNCAGFENTVHEHPGRDQRGHSQRGRHRRRADPGLHRPDGDR